MVIHFAISHRPTRGSISSYNMAGLISDVFEEVGTQIAKNCRRRQPHSHLRNPRDYPHIPYISRNYSHWPTFLSLHVWVYLHSNLCSMPQSRAHDKECALSEKKKKKKKKHVSFLHQSAFCPFKVIQGR